MSRRTGNQGYIPRASEIWTTTQPPTYDHIDESSMVNPPPSYHSALLLNYQMKENKNNGNLNDVNNKMESAVLYQPNNTNLNPTYVGNDNNNNIINTTHNTTTPTTTNTTNNNNNNDNQSNDEVLIIFKDTNTH
jgi:hypothetical protein